MMSTTEVERELRTSPGASLMAKELVKNVLVAVESPSIGILTLSLSFHSFLSVLIVDFALFGV
jgi:hypothetical protein